MTEYFHLIERAPDDPILGLQALYNADPRNEKVNLGIGSYLDENGSPYLFDCVEQIEKILAEHNQPKNYLPIEGDSLFLKRAIELNLGENTDSDKVFAFQTIGGTGSLSLAAQFIAQYFSKTIAISDPSWANHGPLFRAAGFDVHLYPYFDIKTYKIPFSKLFESLELLPRKSVILIQTACHNPTGIDFTKDEWQILMKLIKKNEWLPLFDNAYQGFGISLDLDVYPLRLFYENGIEMVISSAHSKNFGLYGERIGALIFSINNESVKLSFMSQIKKMIRSHYSSPPIQGAKVVGEILNRPSLKLEWRNELEQMRSRIFEMRSSFAEKLAKKTSNPLYLSIKKGKGFFALLGMSQDQVLQLRDKWGIYLPLNGRINLAGLTELNLEYVVNAIAEILCI